MTHSPSPASRPEALQYRSDLYRLLGHLYRRELTPELVAELHTSGLLSQMEEQGYEHGLPQASELDDDTMKKLRTDYAYVLIGPGPHVAPYGSIHHPKDLKRGQLWGDTTKQFRRAVKHHGLEFKKGYGGIPDHVGIELEVFSRLLAAEQDALATDDSKRGAELRDVQHRIFGDHLNMWIPRFCERVVKHAGEGSFYTALAQMTRDFLADEKERHYANGAVKQ